MLTYQIRERRLAWEGHPPPTLPADATLELELHPPEPFGAAPGFSRFMIPGQRSAVQWNANTGRTTIQPEPGLEPLRGSFTSGPHTVTVDGNTICVHSHCASWEDFYNLTSQYLYLLPPLLAVEFLDPPYVHHVRGSIGEAAFRLELAGGNELVGATSKSAQEEHIATACRLLDVLREADSHRLHAALIYHHTACRLLASGYTRFEFMAEALLNYAKILDVLFSEGNSASRDQTRRALEKLGFSHEEIERSYIPAFLLRNEFDVAHVSLSSLTKDQLSALHDYTDHAEHAFLTLMQRVLKAADETALSLSPLPREALSKKKAAILDRIRDSLSPQADAEHVAPETK